MPNSWPTTERVQRRMSSKQQGHHTHPAIYEVQRRFLQIAIKQSRTRSDPSQGFSHICREPSCSPSSTYHAPPDREGSTSSTSGERTSSGKRKTSPNEEEGQKKKSRKTPSPVPTGNESGEKKKSQKRKSEEDTEEPRKRSKTSPAEGPSHPASSSQPSLSMYKVQRRFKGSSREGLQTDIKQSRTGSDPSQGFSNICREPSCSPSSVYHAPPDREGSTSSSSGGRMSSGKRKTSPNEEEGEKKKSRKTPSPIPIGNESGEKKKSQKRKSEEDTEEPRKKSKNSPAEGPSHPASSSKPSVSISYSTGSLNSRAAFENKYMELKEISSGGFGVVYNGYRKGDYMPVAIKHIKQADVRRTPVVAHNITRSIPLEVVLLLKVKPAKGQTSAAVALMDWYDLNDELILVLERPLSCQDLEDYLYAADSLMEEHKAKIIVQQLVDAMIEVHTKGVFHRDVKLENILIETDSDVPRVRLIDFGCGTFVKDQKYTSKAGTLRYYAPERFSRGWYTPEPTTVWQLGVVVYAMLHGCYPFKDRKNILGGNPPIIDNLSLDCKDFIRSCLIKKPEARPTLETLRQHPWLV